ncbi:hypothetical protein Tco_1199553 [Tanacetum coccineum]
MKAQELKTKTSAQTLIYKIFLQRYQVYQGRLLASFQDDAKYEHVGQDTRSQDMEKIILLDCRSEKEWFRSKAWLRKNFHGFMGEVLDEAKKKYTRVTGRAFNGRAFNGKNYAILALRPKLDEVTVDAACIPDVGNNGFKTVKDAVGGFFVWPKDQVVFDPKATPPSTIQMNVENKTASKLQTKRKNVYVSSVAVQRQAKKKSL